MSLKDDQTSDLDLLAFRYIAAEMTDEEVGQFELRLAESQEIREAVAKAVQVAQAVAYAQPAVDSESRVAMAKHSHRRRRRQLRLIAVSAAAVAFVAGLGIARWMGWSTNSQPDVAVHEVQPTADLPDSSGVQNFERSRDSSGGAVVGFGDRV